jgi:cell wall-associated NlpC family hydrolase
MDHWANTYIGRPWVPGGRGPAAFDCWGLLVHVYREHYGLTVPPYVGHHSEDIRENLRLFLKEARSGRWRELDIREAKRDGDAVALSMGRRFHHVGVFLDLDGGLILHALQGKGVIAQTAAGLRTFGLNNLRFYRLEP